VAVAVAVGSGCEQSASVRLKSVQCKKALVTNETQRSRIFLLMQQSLKDGAVVPLQGTGVSWVGRNEWQ